MKYWKKLSREAIHQRVFEALDGNVDFAKENILGVPASYLDSKVFYQEAPFLRDAPFLTTLIHNPNHIGCHTLGESEAFFEGTQALERELIRICAEDIFKGEPEQQDGYVASGGTEANIQAAWIYRNYFMREHGATPEEIAILCSEDNHYSVHKAANLLGIKHLVVPVTRHERKIDEEALRRGVARLKEQGIRCVIVVANMMTTMFGSVDDPGVYSRTLEEAGLPFRIHIDGAYGGFIYPFSGEDDALSFRNPHVHSVALDAHKMVQAPYGTGIFLARKGLMDYVYTEEASYVKGLDATLIGSRSGANAIAVWMILMTYGPHGWREKIHVLHYRTRWLCKQLDDMGISYYRHPHANIVAIDAQHVSGQVAKKYGLVPDNHHQPGWYKVVVMEHVTIDKMLPLVEELKHLEMAQGDIPKIIK
jgi:tyrosine decarboxylase/aspartate 1-decarboxylase